MHKIFLNPISILTALLLLLIYIWLKWKYSYWRRHHIPYVEPLPFLGNLKDLLFLRISFGDLFQQLYSAHTQSLSNAPILGIYILHTPALIIRDPDLIKSVLIKNFNMFLNRYEAADPHNDIFGALTLPLAKYPIWREARKRISQLFTSGRLKDKMYPQMLKIGVELEHYVQRHFRMATSENSNAVIIEVKEMCALFTTDLTAMLSYGIDACGLKYGESTMREQARKLLEPTSLKALHFFTIFFLPHLTGVIGAKVFTKIYENFMRGNVNEIIKTRERKSQQNDNDLIGLLTEFQKDCSLHGEYEFVQHPDFIASQAAIFLLAGFETSSSLIAFTLYELAKAPQVQSILRTEIATNLHHKKSGTVLSYENLISMSYLGMVVSEALRLYPAAAFINRECTPGINECGFSLHGYADFKIPKGMPAYISILGLHRDPKHWPNPDCFFPERFLPHKIKSIHPMTYIPFGSGPHGCVGSRLGLLQVKLGLVYILKSFKVETCELTVEKIKFDPKSFMLESDCGIYLRFVKDIN